ncbi:hypothetical protein [Bradyrhizobium sp. SUTN9-2]|uniref:hypothetical protein n=1 Tax=Bradyrhizobium sp. SUTN9-2 TaxID=1167456 RepID=UPI001FCE5EA0|nr:hypothetical protein [Bradyrhizobium sp. SUTN9-2]
MFPHETIVDLLCALGYSVGRAGRPRAICFAGRARLAPPLPAPPPPPKIEVPKVPQFDAPPRYNYQPLPRNSFSDRVTKCLHDGAAAGLGPADRGTYARMCAN